MPPLHADVIAVLDERSSQQVADQLKRDMGDAGRDGGTAASRALHSSLTTGARDAGQTAGRELRGGLTAGIDDAVRQFTGQFGAIGNIAQSTFSGISRGGGMAALGVAGVGVAAVAVGKQLYDLGETWDNVTDGITGRTGKMGADLQGVVDVVKQVGQTAAISLGDIGNIAGGVSQSLHLAGDPLRQMTDQLAKLQQVTGQVVDTRDLGKAFRLFNVDDVTSQTNSLNELLNVSQAVGVPINSLLNTMGQAGKTTRQFGLGFAETAGLLATFDDAGLDAEKTSSGLSVALKNLARDGQDPAIGLVQTIEQIKRLHDAGQEVAAINLSTSVFGRSYSDFLPLIEDGNLDVTKLHNTLMNLGNDNSINKQAEATADWREELTQLTNTLQSDVEPIAAQVFGNINSWLHGITQPFEALHTLFTTIPGWHPPPDIDPNQPHGPNPLAVFGPYAPGSTPGAAVPLPGVLGTLGSVVTGGPAAAPPTGPALRPPGIYSVNPSYAKDWYPPVANDAAGGPRLPAAPAVSLAGVPSLAPGLQQTASLLSAQNSVADAQTKVAEKEARLNQLLHGNVASADDILKARNDVALAERDASATQMRFAEAQQSAFEQQNKRLGKLTGDLNQFGAKLDDDLGISDGLSGIADNLARFLGNIIAAPAMAQLNAISAANPNQGFGLMGSLASQGVFGQQYTPAAIAAASGGGNAYGSTASYMGGAGGYGSDAALLANVPKGIGQYDNVTKDLSRGLVDCASGVEDLVNIMDGKSTAGGSLWTGNASSVLPGMGFMPGMGGPGDFRIGYNSGHMQATLPGGTNVNFGSTSAIQAGGVDGGAGAFDPSFTDHYYRPAGAGAPGIYSPANTNPAPTGGGPGGGPAGPGLGMPQGMPLSGPPVGPFAGPGTGGGVGAAGASLATGARAGYSGANDPYGVPPTAGSSGTPIGITPGGPIDMALGAIPGAGALAQTGAKLVSRGIQYGGEVAAIGVQGLMQTFLPAGSEKAGASWFNRIAGGIAGAKPALPNPAGKGGPQAMQPGQTQQGQGQAPPPAGDTYNTTIQSSASTIDGAANDWQFHLGAQNSGPGH
ncbi:phage tail tape measure protein [soil metagenome]